MKDYEKPILEEVEVEIEDIIATSAGGYDETEGMNQGIWNGGNYN